MIECWRFNYEREIIIIQFFFIFIFNGFVKKKRFYFKFVEMLQNDNTKQEIN